MHSSTFILVVILSLSRKLASGYDGRVKISPQNGTEVIYKKKLRVTMNTPFNISSDIPVTLLRYSYTQGDFFDEIIEKNRMWVVVRTNCPEKYGNVTINVRRQKGEVHSLSIESNSGDDTIDALKKSDMNMNWFYNSFWCEAGYGDDGGDRRRMEKKKANIFQEPDVDNSEQSDVKGDCGALVEVLYDGCKRPVKVDSPALKVTNMEIRNRETFDTQNKCTKRYEGKVVRVNTWLRDSNTTVDVRQLQGRRCTGYVEGRPYIDSNGHQLQADAVKSETACWVSQNKNETHIYQHVKAASHNEDEEDDALAFKWIKRSRGEHSSIASFAAVTISLMTNNAPPELIRDSLRAALDEVDHATASFKVASLLSGEIIEPGNLPPSSHHFETDIRGLTTRTFEEGCIDETISAVAAAAEADSYTSSTNERNAVLLLPELSKIARDEARHAALAFRTVHWGCGIDPQWCQESIVEYFKLSSLESYVANRFPVSFRIKARMKLEYLYGSLLGFVTRTNSASAETLCENHISSVDRKQVGVMDEVIDSIVREVLCGSTLEKDADILTPVMKK